MFTFILNLEKFHIKLMAGTLVLVFVATILSLTVFIACHRRAKLKRYQQRCKYFEVYLATILILK